MPYVVYNNLFKLLTQLKKPWIHFYTAVIPQAILNAQNINDGHRIFLYSEEHSCNMLTLFDKRLLQMRKNSESQMGLLRCKYDPVSEILCM